MRKIIFALFFLVLFFSLVASTTFEIGNDENNLTTFTFNSLTEKIVMEGNGALIIDLINFNIDVEHLDQSLSFSFDLPYNDGRNLSISSFEFLACGSQLAHENSLQIHSPGEYGWGLNCGKYFFEKRDSNSKYGVSSSIFLQGIPLGDREKNSTRVTIYLQVKYFLNNYVIENEGEYEYIPIDRFQMPDLVYGLDNSEIFLVMPEGTILEEKSNFDLKKVGNKGEIVLNYKNPIEDSFITFRDAERGVRDRVKRDVIIIAITLALSLVFGFFTSEINLPRVTRNLWMFAGLFLFLTAGLLLYSYNPFFGKNILLVSFFCLFFVFCFLAIYSGGRKGSIKKDLKEIKDLVCSIFCKEGGD